MGRGRRKPLATPTVGPHPETSCPILAAIVAARPPGLSVPEPTPTPQQTGA